MLLKSQRLSFILGAVAVLLLIPFIAMQFTQEVMWTGSDFLIMGILLLGTGLLCELVFRKVTKTTHRIVLCAGVLFAFLLVWAELAVGVFGSPWAGS